MTQRFGGLFSVLNRREISDFYKAIDFASEVDVMGGFGDDYSEEIKNLERQSLDMLIEIAEAARNALEFTFFDSGGPGEEGHKVLSERIGSEYWPTITKARQFMSFLDKIKSKLERGQRKLGISSLDKSVTKIEEDFSKYSRYSPRLRDIG